MSSPIPSDLPASPTPGSSLRDQLAETVTRWALMYPLANWPPFGRIGTLDDQEHLDAIAKKLAATWGDDLADKLVAVVQAEAERGVSGHDGLPERISGRLAEAWPDLRDDPVYLDQLGQEAAKVVQPGDFRDFCGASAVGLFGVTLGPCILRHGHDGPVHEDTRHQQWTHSAVSALVQPALDAKDVEIAALRAGESVEPGGDVPQAWTPAQWIHHWNRLPADERLATVRRIYAASRYMAACLLERHEEQITALTRRAEEAETEVAALREQTSDEAKAALMNINRWRAEIRQAEAERDRLRYERRLLGFARMTLDLVASGDETRWPQARREAEDIAQRIVDEIGHPVTDEPALGPSLRAERDRLMAAIQQIREAKRGLDAAIIASAHRLDEPFTDRPEMSPWKVCKLRMKALDDAVKAALDQSQDGQ